MADKKKEPESKKNQGARPEIESLKPKVVSLKPKAKALVKINLSPIEELGRDIKPWELAGLMRAAGWAEGKQVTAGDFKLALTKFRQRPQGGGKI
ncbi:MAG: hypothetical protein JRC93_13665 [Deltaproteobacteria bacterium]|nr:hypothetical protein [Deltaproteobacteria bacterium]